MENLSKIVGENLSALRKYAGLTQTDVANKFNYSDKAVSKWEKGESLPNIEVLKQLANFYKVSLDYLTEEKHEKTKLKMNELKPRVNKKVLSLLSICGLWLLGLTLFVTLLIALNVAEWKIFVWLCPCSFTIALIFNCIWGKKRNNYIFISFIVWTIIAAFYLQFLQENIWPIFLIGLPAQIIILLTSTIKERVKSQEDILLEKQKHNITKKD